MITSIYRFRPIEALLDKFHELERQEIYFAAPSELNDPHDGALDIQWCGDPILWTNFLNHYFLCLTQATLKALIIPDDPELFDNAAIVRSENELPSEAAKRLYRNTKSRFYAQPDALTLPNLLAGRTRAFNRNELCMYLRVLHTGLVELVKDVIYELGDFGLRAGGDKTAIGNAATKCCEMLKAINVQDNTPNRLSLGGALGDWSESMFYQQSLRFVLDRPVARNRALMTLLTDFPSWYLTELATLVYSDWFTASFVEDATNAAMWGVYANSHKGVALKFRTIDKDGQPALILNRITGYSGGRGGKSHTIRSDVPHILEPVRYPKQFATIDFFQSMARITGHDAQYWHFDETGKQSPRSVAAGFDTDEWRREYWTNLKAALTTKHEDWKHERERRIVLHDGFVDFRSSAEARKLVYRFDDLEGIVFGWKTPAPRVIEIVRAVREKCAKLGRKNFDFLRAQYSRDCGKMILVPLSLLRIG